MGGFVTLSFRGCGVCPLRGLLKCYRFFDTLIQRCLEVLVGGLLEWGVLASLGLNLEGKTLQLPPAYFVDRPEISGLCTKTPFLLWDETQPQRAPVYPLPERSGKVLAYFSALTR